MRLIRFRVDGGEPLAGVLDDAGVVSPAAAPALAGLLALPLNRIREICADPGGETMPQEHAELLAPVDGRTEVWAAGVTYERSRTARMAESEDSADIYDRVYAAERPELFFKSAAWRVCGPGVPASRPTTPNGSTTSHRRPGPRRHWVPSNAEDPVSLPNVIVWKSIDSQQIQAQTGPSAAGTRRPRGVSGRMRFSPS